MDQKQFEKDQLQRVDEARLPGRAERTERTRVHEVIPNHFFSAASSECRDTFIDGHYYACVSLEQAVAEGLVRFLNGFHPVGAKNDPNLQAQRLKKAGAFSQAALDAFLRIWSNDRNTFHHLNQDLPPKNEELRQRAEDCVKALFEIESELFAYDLADGENHS